MISASVINNTNHLSVNKHIQKTSVDVDIQRFNSIQFNSIQFNSIQFNSIQLKTNEMILMYVLDFLLHQTHNKNDNLFRRSCHWVLDVDRPTYDFPMVQ
jgi:hypothetical protein